MRLIKDKKNKNPGRFCAQIASQQALKKQSVSGDAFQYYLCRKDVAQFS